jgi:rubrerythrin
MAPTDLHTALGEALDIENRGKTFYAEARDQCRHALGKQIFAHLVQEEDSHIARISEVYKILERGGRWPQDLQHPHAATDTAKFFDQLVQEQAQHLKGQADDIKALKTAQNFELMNEKFYRELSPKTQDRACREFFERLAQEERGHYLLVTDTIAYLVAPEQWFAEKEKVHLDGA